TERISSSTIALPPRSACHRACAKGQVTDLPLRVLFVSRCEGPPGRKFPHPSPSSEGLNGCGFRNLDRRVQWCLLDAENFQSLLEQVRELHRLADEVTRERARFDAYVQARLRWDDRKAPVLPAAQRDLADEAVEALSKPRLSSVQSRQLYRAFFRKSGR
ncbi:MAG TPA: hypothetical protein VFP10_11190, partial [Candidatus Eisenbacteria bacterium]|nr:hypothetical protein [Candidatus Eisenbacteria bacterium]